MKRFLIGALVLTILLLVCFRSSFAIEADTAYIVNSLTHPVTITATSGRTIADYSATFLNSTPTSAYWLTTSEVVDYNGDISIDGIDAEILRAEDGVALLRTPLAYVEEVSHPFFGDVSFLPDTDVVFADVNLVPGRKQLLIRDDVLSVDDEYIELKAFGKDKRPTVHNLGSGVFTQDGQLVGILVSVPSYSKEFEVDSDGFSLFSKRTTGSNGVLGTPNQLLARTLPHWLEGSLSYGVFAPEELEHTVSYRQGWKYRR